jgi:hypothetical protein
MFVELLSDHLGQKASTRIDVSDADGSFLISAGRAKAVAGDPLSDAVGRSIAEAMGEITGGLEKAVDVAYARFAQAQTKSHRNSLSEIFGEGADGDPKRTLGAFLIASYHSSKATPGRPARAPHQPTSCRPNP